MYIGSIVLDFFIVRNKTIWRQLPIFASTALNVLISLSNVMHSCYPICRCNDCSIMVTSITMAYLKLPSLWDHRFSFNTEVEQRRAQLVLRWATPRITMGCRHVFQMRFETKDLYMLKNQITLSKKCIVTNQPVQIGYNNNGSYIKNLVKYSIIIWFTFQSVF